jgi:macrodomain Ter protein organizer (MatP/YcbG family)
VAARPLTLDARRVSIRAPCQTSHAKNAAHASTLTVKVALDLEHAVVVRLRREAPRRETTLDYLLRSLLDTIATDQFVTAVLDDGSDLPSA